MVSILTTQQYKSFGPRKVTGYGADAWMTVKVRFDDQCGNGHNTFSITADVVTAASKRRNDMHDEIVKWFPSLEPLIKWHLCSTDGPMHGIANTIYHASDRDHWGLRKGEFRQHTSRGQQNDGVAGVPHWELAVPEVAARHVYAADKPAPITLEWRPSGITGEGKDRELDAARRCAIWPEATDEDLTAPGLKERLEARMPALLVEFRAAIESLGFTW